MFSSRNWAAMQKLCFRFEPFLVEYEFLWRNAHLKTDVMYKIMTSLIKISNSLNHHTILKLLRRFYVIMIFSKKKISKHTIWPQQTKFLIKTYIFKKRFKNLNVCLNSWKVLNAHFTDHVFTSELSIHNE